MKAWAWFETKMYGRPLPRLPRAQRLKLLLVSALLGVALGVTLYATGLGQSFLAAGLKSAGYDPRTLYQNAAAPDPTATTWPAATPPTTWPAAAPPTAWPAAASPTTTLPRRRGGWVTPAAP